MCQACSAIPLLLPPGHKPVALQAVTCHDILASMAATHPFTSQLDSSPFPAQAVTCDDFLAAMADANSEDLSSLAKCAVFC